MMSEPLRRTPIPIPTLALAVTLLTLLVYLGLSGNQFIGLDTEGAIIDNPHIARGLTLRGLAWAFTNTTYYDYWHPLTWVSHMLDVSLYGLKPGGHHLTNLVVHMMSVFALCVVLHRMTRQVWPSVLAAALFGLHPVHVESVAWVVERKDVLSGLLFVLSVGFYVSYTRVLRPSRYVVSLLMLVLGLMAKPMLVTLPFVLLLIDVWPLKRLRVAHIGADEPPFEGAVTGQVSTTRVLAEKAPYFVLAAVSSVLTVMVVGGKGATVPFAALPLAYRIQNALVSYVAYLRNIFWPSHLAVYYPQREAFHPAEVAAALAVMAGVSALAVITRRRHPHILIGWLWFTGMLVPVIGLIQTGDQAMADRFVYLPSIGIYLLVAGLLSRFAQRGTRSRAIAVVASAIAVSALASKTVSQVGLWRDTQTLFTYTLHHYPRGKPLLNNLGTQYLSEQRYTEAVDCFTRAIALDSSKSTREYANLGFAQTELGRHEEAVRTLQRALQQQPMQVRAHLSLALALERLGQDSLALHHARTAAHLHTERWNDRLTAGVRLLALGEDSLAERCFIEASDMAPRAVAPVNNLGALYDRKGDLERAYRQYVQAIALSPEDFEPYMNAGNVLLRAGRCRDALPYFEFAAKLVDTTGLARFSAARAYQCLGKIDSATAALEACLRAAPDAEPCRDLMTQIRGGAAESRTDSADTIPRTSEVDTGDPARLRGRDLSRP